MAKFYTAVVTVFHEDGTLDYEGNKAVYEHLIQAGSDGIVLMGSTGEFCSMTMDMAKELTDPCRKYCVAECKYNCTGREL